MNRLRQHSRRATGISHRISPSPSIRHRVTLAFHDAPVARRGRCFNHKCNMIPYAQQLKDPRWQRKRLEILQAANFKCQMCGAADRELHVHHSFYEKDHKPWDYPNDSLFSLCEGCHKCAELRKKEFGDLFCLSIDAYPVLLGIQIVMRADAVSKLPQDIRALDVLRRATERIACFMDKLQENSIETNGKGWYESRRDLDR